MKKPLFESFAQGLVGLDAAFAMTSG